MESTTPKLLPWLVAIAGAASLTLVSLFGSGCSLLLDHGSTQCSTDEDCVSFGGRPSCQRGVCVPSNLGPEGCYFGNPTTPEQFANRCTTSQCEPFDNCARLNQCGPNPSEPALILPVAGPPGPPPADPPPGLPLCVTAGRNTVVVTGSTAVQPFLSIVAKVLAESSPSYVIAYQGTGSCNGVDHIFNADPSKRLVKDTAGRTNLLFDGEKAPEQCSFGTVGVSVDVGISDVFSRSCNPTYVTNDRIAEYLGAVQPMTFVVPSGAKERSISAEMARVVFGRGSMDPQAAPFTDPALYFVRSSTSGTQQMISRAINVNAGQWWGVDRGGSTRVRDQLLAVDPARADGAIGILSTDFADAERARLRVLAFQDRKQLCGYYPDSSLFTRDKRNVRDGHYSIWGPIHFYTAVSAGIPSAAAAALVTRFGVPRLDQSLLDAIIKAGLIPQCAMKVTRGEELGSITAFSPDFQCGCYFEANVPNGAAPESCKTCSGPADCPASTPACNNGYCELK
jgi:ABC-type phosphate transport system substrate-binding protein